MSLTLARLGVVAGSFPIAPAGDYESIATVTVGSGGAANIEFTSIPGTYQHLQMRYIARTATAAAEDTINAQVNSDTGSNYAFHNLGGNGTATFAGAQVSQTKFRSTRSSAATETASVFGAGILDILDYASTSKYTTFRTFGGMDGNGNGQVVLNSGLWMSTSAITSVKLISDSTSNFVQYSTAALYGIKAP